MAEATFEYKIARKKTTKENDCIVCENYEYYYKRDNAKSKTTNWIFSEHRPYENSHIDLLTAKQDLKEAVKDGN